MKAFEAREDGFTLLEVLIGLTLAAIFLLMMTSSLRFALHADSRVDNATESFGRLQRAERFLRSRISLAQPVWVPAESSGHIDFTGTPSTLEFLAPTPDSMGGIGFARYRLSVEPDAQSFRLTVRVAFGQQPSAALKWSEPNVLLAGASAIVFLYFGMTDGNRGRTWQQTWSNRRSMPDNVVVRVSEDAGSGVPPIDLSMRPRIEIEPNCQIDVVASTCIGH